MFASFVANNFLAVTSVGNIARVVAKCLIQLIKARFRHWILNALCVESYSYVTVRTGFISAGIRNCAIGVDVAESDAINLHPVILPAATDLSAEYVGNS